jgi:hypothetical protein
MNNNIQFSLVSPAIRTENWMRVYNSILSNNCKFELIFAGPRKPEFKLPDNFRYINTNVKPAQCWELLYKNSKGNYIMNISDDLIFRTKNPLNKLTQELERYKNQKILIGLRYKFRNIEQTKHMTFKINNDQDQTELLPMCPPLRRKLWYKYKRFDSRFICTLMEADFFLRMTRDGYKVINSEVLITEDKDMEDVRKMSRDYMRIDRKLMLKLWTKKENGEIVFSKTRNEPVKNFLEKNLLTKSQRPCGRWSNNNILYNYLITSKLFYIFNLYYYARLQLYKVKKIFNGYK